MTSSGAATTVIPVIMIVIVVTVIVRKRIPANIVIDDKQSDKGRIPPTAAGSILAIRSPIPGAVIINPPAVVIRGPTPRLVVHPRPAKRRNPTPVAVTIWRPVGILACRAAIRSPDIPVFAGVNPFTVIVEVIGTVYVTVVIFVVIGISQSLGYCYVTI